MTTPAPYPGGSYQPAPRENGMGTAALVLGILGLLCLGPIGSVPAIVFGRIGITRADQGLADNKSSAQWGFWLGIVGLVLSVLGISAWILIFAVAAGSST